MAKERASSCLYCGGPSLLGLTHPKCKKKLGVDGSISIYKYPGVFRRLLYASKYKGAFNVLNDLIDFSLKHKTNDMQNWNRLYSPTITHVPLHPNRILKRGFNQSELIARRYSARFGFVRANILSRIIDTPHLATMTGVNMRKRTIKGAFKFVGKTAPSCVILVDDVTTTGSTLFECANVLKNNGVQVVLTISLAKG